ncbi:MAG: hypothetical protein CMI53_02000 [Parcubacteria group bacterium]|nr:hypothetical protein [Parcubacteria group bacterium]|tara:strand:+ start:1927 stop:3525 length:1599 start_codon:yes stop_codon:yes gene_type:complete
MKLFKQILLLSFAITLSLGNFLFVVPVPPAYAALELIKSNEFGTVYYLDSRGARHPFPNAKTYESWYGNDFSRIVTVSNEFLFNYPLGKNITIRPGTFLVKVRTAPEVYAVEQGGVLREIQNESIAEAIYGENWASRVVDVPDVFFENYLVGQPIVHDYTTPDSILYKDESSGKYYFRNDNILRPFASTADIFANRFNLDFALTRNRSHFVREKPISGQDKNIFNPVAGPIIDRRDCSASELKAAIILLADKNYSSAEVTKVQNIKQEVADYFSWVTDDLSSINLDHPTAIILDDGYLIRKRNDGTTEVKNETINTFYDNNPDDFDFIFVFTNFKTPSESTNEIAHFIAVTNRQEGLNKSMLNRSEVYGSQGKLKGIVMMGDVNKYSPETPEGLNSVLNVVVHEILHNWAAYVEFEDSETDENSEALLRPNDLSHWSNYVSFISPLGGSGWMDNGDGTFTNGLSLLPDTNQRQYSQLDLYLMGLVRQKDMAPISYIIPDEENAIGNVIAATEKQITIDQIVEASGKVKCSID